MKQLRINLSKCDAGRNCKHECEEICATKMFKFDDPARAALHIRELPDGHGQAIICDQCGDCLSICPTNALTRSKVGVVRIDKKICVGCFVCIGYCDKDAFERAPGATEPYKCTSCGLCVKACPHVALELVEVPAPPTRLASAPTSTPAKQGGH
jgi:anaerobic carbon-monoxide dehydrogenase iron sulfur subunit